MLRRLVLLAKLPTITNQAERLATLLAQLDQAPSCQASDTFVLPNFVMHMLNKRVASSLVAPIYS